MSVYYHPYREQQVKRWTQERGCCARVPRTGPMEDRYKEERWFDITHLSVCDVGSGAGGTAQADYIVGLDSPEMIAWVETHMEGLCAKINEHFASLPPQPANPES